MQETKSSKRPAYGREIAGDFGRSLVMPFNGTWRGRYVWWMQALEAVVLGLACWVVWDLTGNAIATGATFFGVLIAASLVELEARVTERHLERARLSDSFGLELDGPSMTIADGYVLAYERGNQPGQMFTDADQPFIQVGAVPADRWDLLDAAWTFAVKGAPGSGLTLVIDKAGLPALAQLGGLWRELAEGEIGDLVTFEQRLAVMGARDMTSAFHQPPR